MLRIRMPQYAPPGGRWFYTEPQSGRSLESLHSMADLELKVVDAIQASGFSVRLTWGAFKKTPSRVQVAPGGYPSAGGRGRPLHPRALVSEIASFHRWQGLAPSGEGARCGPASGPRGAPLVEEAGEELRIQRRKIEFENRPFNELSQG